MNRQRAQELIPIMTAYVNGQDIQVWSNRENNWAPASTPTFNDGRRYRIKPKPVTRPWSKPEDVPGPVCWLRNFYGESYRMVIGLDPKGPICIGTPHEDYESSRPFLWDSLTSWEYSTDCKTWHPCTVMEELP